MAVTTVSQPFARTIAPGLLAALGAVAAWAQPAMPRPGAAVSSGAAAAAPSEWSYRVVPGDTLIGLTATLLRPGVGWRQLQQRNQVADPYQLPPGKELRIPISWLRAEAAVAEVLHVRGDVRLLRDAGETPDLAAGATLRNGDALRTGAQSSVALRFVDGARVLISPDSLVRMERLMVLGRSGVADTRLRLEQGAADSQVPAAGPKPAVPGYRIDTPSLNLGVRGTEFRVRHAADRGVSQAEVLAGLVAAAGGQGPAQQVGAGFGTDAATAAAANLPRRLLPAPELPPPAAPLDRLPLQADWPPLAGAARYRAQVFEAGEGEVLLLDGVFAQPEARWSDLADGRYRLRVRGIDESGLEGRHAQTDFVLKARPEPPFIREPRAGQRVFGGQVEFQWARSSAAARYRLLVVPADAASGAPMPAADVPGLGGTEHRLALPPGRYTWRVASVAGEADQGPWSDPQPFELRTVPPSPAAESHSLAAGNLRLRWGGLPGTTYQVQVSTEPGFAQPLIDRQVQAMEVEVPDPRPGTYHMRVRALDGDFAGPWGPAQRVEVPHSRWWLLAPVLLILLL